MTLYHWIIIGILAVNVIINAIYGAIKLKKFEKGIEIPCDTTNSPANRYEENAEPQQDGAPAADVVQITLNKQSAQAQKEKLKNAELSQELPTACKNTNDVGTLRVNATAKKKSAKQ